MFKLALKFLFSRKKWLVLMVCSFAIIIASVTSIFTASEAIKESLKKNAYDQFGEHTGILTGIDETKKALQKKALKVGEFQLVNTIVFDKNKLATVGWMDADALKMGHIKLLAGTYPKKNNEVAIESAYLQLMDINWKIGQKRKLQINKQEVNVRLVGIVKNYSAQWSVPIDLKKGKNDLPNIFISSQRGFTDNKSKSFLIKLDVTKNSVEEKMGQLLNDYNQNGIVNERLYNKGLIDYDTVFFLSVVFQSLTILFSLFSIASLFTYFNIEQSQKIAILKAIGANKRNLYKLYFFQSITIFILSVAAAVPFQFFLHFLIIDNSFKQGVFPKSTILFQVSIIASWLLLLFLIMFFIAIQFVKKSDHFSVNEWLNRKIDPGYLYDVWTEKITIHSFTIKQLARQLFIYPKQIIFTILILCFSILLITFSVFIQKESAGIWDNPQSYYLTSQETYGYKTIDSLNVLKNQGLTFSVEDVKDIENTPGVVYVDKTPFMVDVQPLINPKFITPTLRKWIEEFATGNNIYNDKEIIPNVRYTIVNSKEFKELFSGMQYKAFIGKVMLYLPAKSKILADKELIGKKLSLIKMVNGTNGLKTKQKDFKIAGVINKPLVKKIINSYKIENEEVTIVLDEQTAVQSGLFPGYNELGIYTKNNLSNREYENIDNKINRLIATFPGSLLQNIPKFIKEDSKIYSLVGFLGILSFSVAVVLSVISIVMIVFGKFQLQKRNWGIYLSLGMNKNQVVKFLLIEMMFYLVMSVLVSGIIFIIALSILNHTYPVLFYLNYFSLAVLMIFSLLIVGSLILGRVIKDQSVFSILRRVE